MERAAVVATETDLPLGVRHAALAVSDLPRALAFYIETLGFTPAYVTDRDWAMLSLGGTTLSLVPVPHFMPLTLNGGGSHPAHIGIVLPSMEAVDALHQRIRYTDVPSLEAPKRHRDGSYGFYLTDLDGNALECIFIPYRLQGAANPEPSGDAVVLLAPGDPDPAGGAPYKALLAGLRRHAVDTQFALAFSGGAKPTLADVLPVLLAEGQVRRVRVVPVSLSAGDPGSQALPRLIDAVRLAHPTVTIQLAPALGEHPLVQEAMTQAIIESVGGP